MRSDMGVYLPLGPLEFGFRLLWDSCTVYLSCDCSPAFRICCFLAGVLFRVRLIDLDTEMFTTKVWYEYDMLRTSSISLLLACHVSSASMSGVYNRRHNKFTFNHKVGITIN